MKTFTFKIGQFYTIEDIPESHRDIFLSCHHQGRCDDDVKDAEPFFTVDDFDGLREHLKGYGAWDSEELKDDSANLQRLLWLGAGDIQERGEFYIGE
jgi:hypothetical protein